MIKKGLTGNQLKLIALITMTVDHVGMLLLPQYPILRHIGRLAYPIYAYMIAEGCRYTKNMSRYLGTMAAMAALCQVVYLVAMASLYQCILVTFSLSIGMILLLRYARQKRSAWAWLLAAAGLLAVFFVTEILPLLLPGTDYRVDYGFWGVLLPVAVYLGQTRAQKLGLAAVLLAALGWASGPVQWAALLALPLLALYNGQRGKWKMKYAFYLYYPAHLVAIHFLQQLLY